jgi:hypothetical protein
LRSLQDSSNASGKDAGDAYVEFQLSADGPCQLTSMSIESGLMTEQRALPFSLSLEITCGCIGRTEFPLCFLNKMDRTGANFYYSTVRAPKFHVQ